MKAGILKYMIISMVIGGFLNPQIIKAQESPASKDLQEYLLLAAENNPELKALYNEYLAMLEQVVQQGVLPDPQLSFGYFIQPVETRVGAQRFITSFSQMFPWFGTLDARQKVAAEKAKVALQVFSINKLALYRDIKILYNKLYYTNRAVAITRQNLELLESLKGIAEINFESGKSGFSAVLQVQMEEEELQNKLQILLESIPPLETEMEQLLNINLEEPINLPDTLWTEKLESEIELAYDEVLKTNPQILRLLHEKQANVYQVEVAEKMGMPSITLGATYTNISSRTDMELPDNGSDALIFPQVGIRLPIYRKKYDAMEKEALLKQEAVDFRIENVKNELLTKLERLYRDYLDAKRKVQLYQRLTTIAEQSLGLLQTEYSTGRNNFFEIIRMEKQLLNYQLELVKAKTELNNNVYRINFLKGEEYEQD